MQALLFWISREYMTDLNRTRELAIAHNTYKLANLLV